MTLKGLPILIGIALIVLNFFVQFIPPMAWLAASDLLLHLGLVVSLLGILLGDIW